MVILDHVRLRTVASQCDYVVVLPFRAMDHPINYGAIFCPSRCD